MKDQYKNFLDNSSDVIKSAKKLLKDNKDIEKIGSDLDTYYDTMVFFSELDNVTRVTQESDALCAYVNTYKKELGI